MFCSNCGKQVDERAVVCINCGCAVNNNFQKPEDVPSAGLNILSFLIPFVGLILYVTHHKETPRKAMSILVWTVVGMFVGAFAYGWIRAM